MRFEPSVQAVLRQSGWFPGRSIDVTKWIRVFPTLQMHGSAQNFLEEFGEISIEASGKGVDCAKEPFIFDPSLALGEDLRFEEFSEEIGQVIFPIGEHGRGEFFLGIDESAEMYLLMDGIATLGAADAAIESLINGVGARKIL